MEKKRGEAKMKQKQDREERRKEKEIIKDKAHSLTSKLVCKVAKFQTIMF